MDIRKRIEAQEERLSLFASKTSLQVLGIGLGAGSIASYGRKGDSITFYEINSLVEYAART